MYKFLKAIFGICSLMGVCVSVVLFSLFYHIPLVSEKTDSFLQTQQWFSTLLSSYIWVMGLIFLVAALLFLIPGDGSLDLIIKRGRGEVRFSRQALESTLHDCFKDMSGINSSYVRAKISKHPEKTKIFVKLSINDSKKIIDLAQIIQSEIEDVLISSIGVTVESINVKITEYKKNLPSVRKKPRATSESRTFPKKTPTKSTA